MFVGYSTCAHKEMTERDLQPTFKMTLPRLRKSSPQTNNVVLSHSAVRTCCKATACNSRGAVVVVGVAGTLIPGPSMPNMGLVMTFSASNSSGSSAPSVPPSSWSSLAADSKTRACNLLTPSSPLPLPTLASVWLESMLLVEVLTQGGWLGVDGDAMAWDCCCVRVWYTASAGLRASSGAWAMGDWGGLGLLCCLRRWTVSLNSSISCCAISTCVADFRSVRSWWWQCTEAYLKVSCCHKACIHWYEG